MDIGTMPLGARARLLDEPGSRPQTVGMAEPKDLMAVDVHTEDVGDYNVTEAGWYAVDDGGKVVLGPPPRAVSALANSGTRRSVRALRHRPCWVIEACRVLPARVVAMTTNAASAAAANTGPSAA